MMDYRKLMIELKHKDTLSIEEKLDHLHSELAAAKARCETLDKMVTKYQDELIPGYRERAEKAERERDAAVKDLNELLGMDEFCPLQCEWCAWNGSCDGTKKPVWRGPQNQ